MKLYEGYSSYLVIYMAIGSEVKPEHKARNPQIQLM